MNRRYFLGASALAGAGIAIMKSSIALGGITPIPSASNDKPALLGGSKAVRKIQKYANELKQ